jgi:hypothetical protein
MGASSVRGEEPLSLNLELLYARVGRDAKSDSM